MHPEPTPYIHRQQHRSYECCMRHLSLALGLSSSTSSAAQRWPLSIHAPGLLQDSAAPGSCLHTVTKGNCTPFQGPLLSLAFLLPATLTLSAFGPFSRRGRSFLGHRLPLLSSNNLNFPCSVHTNSHTRAQPHT